MLNLSEKDVNISKVSASYILSSMWEMNATDGIFAQNIYIILKHNHVAELE